MLIYFGLGSNLGDRSENLSKAIGKLKLLGKIKALSSVYETEPWGGVPQPDYLNMCVSLECFEKIKPLEILRAVKNFEADIGRVPSVRWGERKIDIDILLIDDITYSSSELTVPHVNIPDRLFVLVPLSEILPEDWKHPVNNQSVHEMIDKLANNTQNYPKRVFRFIIQS